ncbi:MAG: M24 family metallopeptidase [Parvibaculaceae bacterium]
MTFDTDLTTLARQRRSALFDRLGGTVGAVVTTDPVNKGYLTGYHSMSNDTIVDYRTAAVATRERAVLVVSAADAGPALERVGDPALIYRYGTFYFESAPDQSDIGYDLPGYPSFEAALEAAIRAIASAGETVGTDFAYGGEVPDGFHGKDVRKEILACRLIKLPGEIERIRHATKLVEDGIAAMADVLRPGVTENELAGVVAHRMAAGGGTARFISVTSGPRSALADAYPTGRRIREGELVRFDGGCVVDGFASDMARTLSAGDPGRLATSRYAALAHGLEAELSVLRAGVAAGSLHKAAVDAVRHTIASYRRHHVGHGLGVNGYEAPILSEGSRAQIEAGMCLCVETPYYQLGWGGMMVEDTVVVTERGYEAITTLPHDLLIV